MEKAPLPLDDLFQWLITLTIRNVFCSNLNVSGSGFQSLVLVMLSLLD